MEDEKRKIQVGTLVQRKKNLTILLDIYTYSYFQTFRPQIIDWTTQHLKVFEIYKNKNK